MTWQTGLRLLLSFFFSMPLAMGYGLFLRALAGEVPGLQFPQAWESLMTTLSAAFLCFGPLAMGALTVGLAPREFRDNWVYALAAPAVNCALWVFIVMMMNWEVAICILMALPLVFPAAIIGGVVIWAIARGLRSALQVNVLLAVFMLLPYLIAPLERKLPPPPDSLHTVETSIVMQATPQTVWATLIRVPEIQPAERDFRLFHFLGMPWPVAADLADEGLGAVRYAQYENGLRLVEPITDWQPYQVFSFDINVLEPERLSAPYNQIGGPMFEPLRAAFFIEPLAENQVRVRLVSVHRLTTPFNTYGSWWTKFFMADLQNHILHILKERAEKP